jgi:lambda repressor-like predicted transcriptional regulator
MQTTQNRIEISPVMLENAVRKRHMSLESASSKMGYSKNQLYVCMQRGYLTRPNLVALESILGIKLEEIQTPKVEVVDAPALADGIDHMKLYNTIYYAVKNAMRDALNEEGK